MTVVELPLHLHSTAYVVRCADGCKCHTGDFRTRARANHWRLQSDLLCSKGPHRVAPIQPAAEVS